MNPVGANECLPCCTTKGRNQCDHLGCTEVLERFKVEYPILYFISITDAENWYKERRYVSGRHDSDSIRYIHGEFKQRQKLA